MSEASAKYRAEGKSPGTETLERFVTVSLHVDYLASTPIDTTLELRGRVKESKGRKMVISVTLFARGKRDGPRRGCRTQNAGEFSLIK